MSNAVVALAAVDAQVALLVVGLAAVSPALGAVVVTAVGAVADHGQQRPPPHAAS